MTYGGVIGRYAADQHVGAKIMDAYLYSEAIQHSEAPPRRGLRRVTGSG
jgi:hypothetical protein